MVNANLDPATPAMGAIVVCSLRKHAAPVPEGFQPIRVDRSTSLGNPYPERLYGRTRCIALYRDWLNDQLADPDAPAAIQFARIHQTIRRGQSVALMCWCAPLPCHADVIKARLEGQG